MNDFKPDYGYWARFDLWSAEQAVMLFIDCDPAQLHRPPRSLFDQELLQAITSDYHRLADLLRGSIELSGGNPGLLCDIRHSPAWFVDWAARKQVDIPAGLVDALREAGPQRPSSNISIAAVPRTQAQDAALVGALRDAGYDPNNLPSYKPGKNGVKAAMRKVLVGTPLFTRSAFDHAWKRLKPHQ